MPGTDTVGGALRAAVEAVAKPDRKAEAEALIDRLTSGDAHCRYCGGDAAAGWAVCYACCHVPEGE